EVRSSASASSSGPRSVMGVSRTANLASFQRRSVEQVRLALGDRPVQRAEVELSRGRRADLLAGRPGIRSADRLRRSGRPGQQLRIATAIHGDEPPGRLFDRVTDRQQAVVSEDHRLAVAERGRDAPALARIEYYAGVVLEHRVIFEKRAV